MKLHLSVFTLILFAEIKLKIFASSLLKIVDIEAVASFLNLQDSVLSSANKVRYNSTSFQHKLPASLL